jgi:2-isopropylmalate synthase
MKVCIYDTTLRDGAQQEGISFSVEDKLKILRKLDDLRFDFIEGGWPGANPKDDEFFERAQNVSLHHAVLTSFGSTRKPKVRAEDDPGLQHLRRAGPRVATIVGKSWDTQVENILGTTLEENLTMVGDSIHYLKSCGVSVFFDAEHFFDGYKCNPDYALKVALVAMESKADGVILCDTNGGTLPSDIFTIVKVVKQKVSGCLGIHAHNDADLAVANTLAAVEAGATQVQGTVNGYGERCGNANLCSVIPNLKLKLGIDCINSENLSKLTEISRYISEVANLSPFPRSPYVGASAFAHKAGLHASGMAKWPQSYQHTDPCLVGNESRVLVSELSGESSIKYKAREKGIDINPDKARAILKEVKALEKKGFQYDGAEASFELLLFRSSSDYRPPFELVDFMVMVERRRRPTADGGEVLAEATVKIKVNGKLMHTASEGNGPVDAMDKALRKALLEFYPELCRVKLVDYKVRILDESRGTASTIRVLVESSDGKREWRTVGSSTNVIEASWQAVADSLEYWLSTFYHPHRP